MNLSEFSSVQPHNCIELVGIHTKGGFIRGLLQQWSPTRFANPSNMHLPTAQNLFLDLKH